MIRNVSHLDKALNEGLIELEGNVSPLKTIGTFFVDDTSVD